MSDQKKLYRDESNKMIAGVCAGLAEYFNTDVSLVRLATVVIALVTGGGGIVAYLVAAIVIPAKPKTEKSDKSEDKA